VASFSLQLAGMPMLALASQDLVDQTTEDAPSNYQVNPTFAAPPSPYTANFPDDFQMEPAIARDPITGRFVAGAMDYVDEARCTRSGTGTIGSTQYAAGFCTASFPYTGIDGVYLSGDGTHWSQLSGNDGAASNAGPCTAASHTLPGYCATGFASGYDVQVAFGPKPKKSGSGFTWRDGGRAYYSNLPLQLGASYPGPAVAVSRSDDDGSTWMNPALAPGTTSHLIVNDKDALWVDSNSSSPCFGDAYLAWDLSTDGGRTWQVAFSRSTDGGATWSSWVTLLNATSALDPGPAVRSLPDGSVIVAWMAPVSQVPSVQAMKLATCGGARGAIVTVAQFANPPGTFPGSSFPVSDFPSLATDLGGRMYMSWIDWTPSHVAVVRFSRSIDEGRTWSTPITVSNQARHGVFPAIATTADGGQVLVAYTSVSVTSRTPGPGATLVQQVYVRSFSGGQTWTLHPLSPTRVDVDGTSNPQLNRQRLGDYVSMMISGKTAFPIWTDSRDAVSCPLVDQYRAALAAGQAVPKPDPDVNNQCPLGFGNSDIYTAAVPLS
jgi:hypothetical protein